MAIQSLCAKIFNGLDVSCVKPVSKYYQQAVIINKSDIDTYTVDLPDAEAQTCAYKVQFALKAGATGYRIQGAEAGSSFYGSVSKTRNDLGYAEYLHNVGILVAGLSEESKCILDGLDKGSFVVALQAKDETVEVFGLVNGLTTGDYEYNIQEGGGGTQIILSSLEDAAESSLPLIYESAVPGQETEDFDDAFAVGT
jgi:hypothetical protein